MQSRPVTEADLSRYRSVMDKQLSKLQKTAAIATKRANAAENQLHQLLTASEKQMLQGMQPEERQRYLAQKRDKDLLSTKKEVRRLREQSRLDAERDRVLREYGLRGDEQGLDYSSFEAFVRTAHASAVKRQGEIQQALKRSRTGAAEAQPPAADEAGAPEATTQATDRADRTNPTRVDTAGPIRVRPVIGTAETIQDSQWALTKGNPQQRKAALDSLRKARQEAVGA